MLYRTVRAGGILLVAGALLASAPAGLQAQEGDGDGDGEEVSCSLEGKEITRQARDRLVQAGEIDSISPEQAQRSYQEALTRLRLALKQDSTDATAYLLAGRAHIGLEQYAEADSMLDRFTDLMPQPGCRQMARRERQSAWASSYNTGIRAYQAGDDSTAREAFERANVIREDPRSLNNAARLNQRLGDRERAAELYQRAMETAEDREQLRAAAINLAELLRNGGNADSALSVYSSYLSAHPDDMTATINYAVSLRSADREDSAQAVFQTLLDRDDLGFRQWFNVGLGLMESSSYQGAIRAFSQARGERPYDKSSMENLVQANMGSGNLSRAATLADSLVDWYPYQKGLYRSLMQALDRQGRTEAVQRILPQTQDMPLEFPRLNMIRQGNAYVVRGQVVGRSAAGSEVTIPFEFFDEQGSVVAAKEATLTVPAEGESQSFQLQVQAEDQAVAGFRYGRVGGGS